MNRRFFSLLNHPLSSFLIGFINALSLAGIVMLGSKEALFKLSITGIFCDVILISTILATLIVVLLTRTFSIIQGKKYHQFTQEIYPELLSLSLGKRIILKLTQCCGFLCSIFFSLGSYSGIVALLIHWGYYGNSFWITNILGAIAGITTFIAFFYFNVASSNSTAIKLIKHFEKSFFRFDKTFFLTITFCLYMCSYCYFLTFNGINRVFSFEQQSLAKGVSLFAAIISIPVFFLSRQEAVKHFSVQQLFLKFPERFLSKILYFWLVLLGVLDIVVSCIYAPLFAYDVLVAIHLPPDSFITRFFAFVIGIIGGVFVNIMIYNIIPMLRNSFLILLKNRQ